MTWEHQLKIELIDSMGTDACIANAARVSFNKDRDEASPERDEKLIHYLAKYKHSSPFRHVQVKVRCTAPIVIARQLVKHQVGMSWNEVSRRYVDTPIELFEQEFRLRPKDNIKQGSSEVAECKHPVHVLGRDASIYSIQRALLNWYDAMIASGFAPETVRGYMPLNMMTSWIWTGSLPAFFHLYNLRTEEHAQKEIQVFAQKTKEVIQPLFPVAWAALELSA